MEPAPVPGHACHCIDDQQSSWSDTKKVNFWLEEPTFTQRELHVTASKVGDTQHHHLAVNKNVRRKTRNVVYKEIL